MSETAAAATHQPTLAVMTRHYRVAGQPDTQGPAENDTTVIPEAITLVTHGNPSITDDTVVDEVTVRGRSVFRNTPAGRVREVVFSAERADRVPAWITALIQAEGLRYRKANADV